MSNDARDWAWSLPDLPTPTRLLLLALAEHVRDGATCFPGQARLAAMCSVSDRQVRNLLQQLRGRGLITVENRPGQGGGRKSNLYRLTMHNRKPDADCPVGNPEPGSRNAGSGCARETGNPAPGNRKAGAGNRNRASDEPEERTVRRKLRDTPPYPPTGGNRDHGQDDFSPSQEIAPDDRSPSLRVSHRRNVDVVPPASTPAQEGNRSASAGRQGTDPLTDRQGSGRGTKTRRGKRNEAHERLAEKDYTVGATRDEDLPDWARAWRDRASDAQ